MPQNVKRTALQILGNYPKNPASLSHFEVARSFCENFRRLSTADRWVGNHTRLCILSHPGNCAYHHTTGLHRSLCHSQTLAEAVGSSCQQY